MRIVFATLAVLLASAGLNSAHADPYRWCAEYGGKSGATNCYFVTFEQCRAAISGVGGFCRANNFYTGPEPSPRRSRRQG